MNGECSLNCNKCKNSCGKEPAFNYIAEAHVTLSDKFYGERIDFLQLQYLLQRTIGYLQELDKIKKSLFYGKGEPHVFADEGNNCAGLPTFVAYDEAEGRNIIHAILGIATESGEMLEALFNAIFEGKSFDVVNMKEENGDIQWYQAVLAKACGFTLEESQHVNIAKLRMRYGEKFSEYDAINRNLKAERSILEASSDVCGGIGCNND